MKKQFACVLPLVLLLCACTRAGEAPALDFPQTQWDMNAQGVMEAWGVTPDEVQNYSAEGRAGGLYSVRRAGRKRHLLLHQPCAGRIGRYTAV